MRNISTVAAVCMATTTALAAPADCFILGDGIARNLSKLGDLNCHSYTRPWQDATKLATHVPPEHHSLVVVAVGSNDVAGDVLAHALVTISLRAKADRVVWVLPDKPGVREQVREHAELQGDHYLQFVPEKNVVQRQYRALAHQVLMAIGGWI